VAVLIHIVVAYHQGGDVLRITEAVLSFFVTASGESGRGNDSDCGKCGDNFRGIHFCDFSSYLIFGFQGIEEGILRFACTE
tara:strand:- start:643 stop:885 length:243 start_codon:yes stop_codon:yes gene_type:complete